MKIVTAHELKTGEVIYWTGAGWSALIAEAALLDDAAATEALKRAEGAETRVVHPYLVPMDGAGSPVARERLRELLRARGPSVHPAFGKQAEARA